jgi:hypothetical protein
VRVCTGSVGRSCEHGSDPSISIKGLEISQSIEKLLASREELYSVESNFTVVMAQKQKYLLKFYLLLGLRGITFTIPFHERSLCHRNAREAYGRNCVPFLFQLGVKQIPLSCRQDE